MSQTPLNPPPSSPPPGHAPAVYAAPPPKRGGIVSKLLTSLITTILIVSLVLNFYLVAFFIAQSRGPSEVVYDKGDRDQRIVILPISGLVDDDMHSFIHDAIKQLKKDPPKAIILRVDSGGGYVSPSDRIWHELSQYKKESNIPIVASFASTAASGAYYIAVVSDTIVIEPTGLTGSIGVIAQAFTVAELMTNIGVTPETVTSTDSVDKDELNPFQNWTDKDRAVLTGILDNAYDRFVEVVYEGRKSVLTEQQVRDLATGAIYTAQQAKENKLVDEIGYLDKAIDLAKKQAGIPSQVDPQVSKMTQPGGFGLLGMLRRDSPDLESLSPDQVRGWLMELSTPKLVYRMPGP